MFRDVQQYGYCLAIFCDETKSQLDYNDGDGDEILD